jgi:hypothetical protein
MGLRGPGARPIGRRYPHAAEPAPAPYKTYARYGRIVLEGQTFGKLKVLEKSGHGPDGILYRCKCECGGEKIASGRMLRLGKVKSCGCMKRGPKVGSKHQVSRRPSIPAAGAD